MKTDGGRVFVAPPVLTLNFSRWAFERRALLATVDVTLFRS